MSKQIDLDAVFAQISFLQGKVLTIVEAALADKEQRRAVKDLTRQAFRLQMDHMERFTNGEAVGASTDVPQPRGLTEAYQPLEQCNDKDVCYFRSHRRDPICGYNRREHAYTTQGHAFQPQPGTPPTESGLSEKVST